MEPDDLAANMVVWYGHHVSSHVFAEYLNTYIEMSKPDYLPMLVYKSLFSKARKAEFMDSLHKCNIEITEA